MGLFTNKNKEPSYEIKVICSNCTNETYLEIPKGTTVKDFLTRSKCNTCGCIGCIVIKHVYSYY